MSDEASRRATGAIGTRSHMAALWVPLRGLNTTPGMPVGASDVSRDSGDADGDATSTSSNVSGAEIAAGTAALFEGGEETTEDQQQGG